MKNLLLIALFFFQLSTLAKADKTTKACAEEVLRGFELSSSLDPDDELFPLEEKLQSDFEAAQLGLRPELQSALEKELYLATGDRNQTLAVYNKKSFSRRISTEDGEHIEQVTQWFSIENGKEVLRVERINSPKSEHTPKRGDVFYTSEEKHTADTKRSEILIFNEWGRVQTRMKLGYSLHTEKLEFVYFGNVSMVEGNVPYVKEIIRYRYTPVTEKRIASKQDQKARTISRNTARQKKRRMQLFTPPEEREDATGIIDAGYFYEEEAGETNEGTFENLYELEGQFVASARQSDLSRTRKKPKSRIAYQQQTVDERLIYRAPSIVEFQNTQRGYSWRPQEREGHALAVSEIQPTDLDFRLTQYAATHSQGGLTYYQNDLLGDLKLSVSCDGKNVCHETWYEDGKMFRSVNGNGYRQLRYGVDRRRFESKPNQALPFAVDSQQRGQTTVSPVSLPIAQGWPEAIGYFMELGSYHYDFYAYQLTYVRR